MTQAGPYPGLPRAEEAEVRHPFGATLRPVVDWFADLAHSKTVDAIGADVKFGGEVAFLVFEGGWEWLT